MTEDDLRAMILRGVFDSAKPLTTAAERRARRIEEAELAQLFRANLSQLHDLQGHPKEPLLWSIAWEHGHSAGLIEVLQYYGEFAELVKP